MSLTAPLLPAAHALGASSSEIIVAYASGPADIPKAWDGLQLPHLQDLLATLTPTTVVQGDEMDFSPPHELALARAMQLPEQAGLIPWAALAAGDTTQPCAFITPCHWHVAPDQVHQTDPASAPMSEEESRQLLALVAPWFSDDGITLEYLRPDTWLARGAAFKDLATASMDRALGRDVRPWMPNPIQGAIIQRLQTELQMLLYTNSFNDQRAQRRLPPINSFWVHGTGSLVKLPAHLSLAVCVDDLRQPSLHSDVQSWQKAWQALDNGLIAQLQQRAARGEPIKLTLCGESNAVQWQSQPRGFMDKIMSVFGAKRLPDLREML
ncbi:phosphoglycerate mutase [Comamonas sp. Y33R10-2]|uniref:phosphoglycerate mutase n=1 Tax=Comamonas sp. Y33R10-2 TaxID=2853257 RepID=UPI001C5CA8DA|nr:phosphoglycerate mutase [Comamonas sp. Y33R10-2]QXZ09984.1 phosphoglycerate mutase [Comamonas sp. Y33R10-2]